MNALESLQFNRKQFTKAWLIADYDRMRTLITNAASFATMTIRTKTKVAEDRFAKFLDLRSKGYSVWFALENINGLMGTQKGTIISLHLISNEELHHLVYVAEFPEEYLGSIIKGLGCAKTSFSLACAGFGKQGCIDVHHERQYCHKVGDATLWNKAIRRGDHAAYRTLITLIWGMVDTAVKQWEDWLANLVIVSGYQTNHAILTKI